jgi:hypothetical protein
MLTVAELREIIKDVPGDALVCVDDGEYGDYLLDIEITIVCGEVGISAFDGVSAVVNRFPVGGETAVLFQFARTTEGESAQG